MPLIFDNNDLRKKKLNKINNSEEDAIRLHILKLFIIVVIVYRKNQEAQRFLSKPKY